MPSPESTARRRVSAWWLPMVLCVGAGASAEDVLLQDFTRAPGASGWGLVETRMAARADGDGWEIVFTKHTDRPTAYPTASLYLGNGDFRDPDWSGSELVLDVENLGGAFMLHLRLDDAHKGSRTFQLPMPAGKRREFRFPADVLRDHNLRTTCMRRVLLHSFKPPEDQRIVLRSLRRAPTGAGAHTPHAFELQDFAFPPRDARWEFTGSRAVAVDNDADGAWEITFPQHVQGHVQFPTALLKLDQSGFVSGNWSGAGLYLDLENPGESFTMQVRLDNEHGDMRTFSIPLPAGERRTHIISNAWMRESGLSSVACMNAVFLHSTAPPKDQRVIVRSLRVDPQLPPAVLRRVEARLERGRAVRDGLPARAPYRAFLDGLLADYAKTPQHLVKGDNDTQFDDRLAHAAYFGGFGPKETFRALAMPNTLKLRPEQIPPTEKILGDGVRLAAARGEYESFQTLVLAGASDLDGVVAEASALSNGKGGVLQPELLRLEYVPVVLPTSAPFGFGQRGRYPDPLAPNAPFAVPAWSGRALFWRVKAPRDAAPGVYRGEVAVAAGGVTRKIPVTVEVFAVDLPTDPRLKTLFIHRDEAGKKDYNGKAWTPADTAAFVDLCREYRINAEGFGSSAILPWDKVFTVKDGTVAADWAAFDTAVETWIGKGKNTFLGYYPGWTGTLAAIKDKEVEGQKFRLTGQHLAEKGWADRFLIYIFDEPDPKRVPALRELCDWIHAQDKNLKIVLTSLHGNDRDYVGHVDVFVPILEGYDEAFGRERIAAGDQYWMYTCISAAATRTPNNWKVDGVGTGQRALGWWLYRFGAQGYLFWGLDWWPVNPWTQANTYQDGNGDGYMLYPDPSGQGLPYASLRMELQRDGFEDFELLHLLNDRAGAEAAPEIRALLNAEGIIESKARFNEDDDALYARRHRELLEALSGKGK